mgnify:CR=1 FL=1
MAKLIVISGDERQEFELAAFNTIGRHPDNTIQILDRIISKEHAQIQRAADCCEHGGPKVAELFHTICAEAGYADVLAQRCGVGEDDRRELRLAALLHDVGKMSVDAAVLKKKGPLTPDEREEMNRHTEYGYQILTASPRLSLGAEIAHREHALERTEGPVHDARIFRLRGRSHAVRPPATRGSA